MDGQALSHITSQSLFKSLGTERTSIVIDVWSKAGFEAADIMIVGATRREPGQVSEILRPTISAAPSSAITENHSPRNNTMVAIAAVAFIASTPTELTYES